jgi:predicted nucleotidyltransferase
MVDRSVVTGVRKYLRFLQDHGFSARFGVVFGSQARGTANPSSDIDLLVVSPRFDKSRRRRDICLLWHAALRTDDRIEPIPCGEKQWETDDESAIIEIARREGRKIKVG